MGTVHAKAEDTFASLPLTPPAPAEQAELSESAAQVSLEGIRARVDKIHVDGLARTKDDIVRDCVRDVLRATDFQEVLLRAHAARLRLDELGCFRRVGVFIDTSKGAGATADGLEVTFSVSEHRRLTGGVSTHVGHNEGALLVGLRAPNLCGRGERVQVEYSHGSRRTSNFNVAFVKPVRGRLRPIFTSSLFQAHSEHAESGYKQLDRGLLLDFGFHSNDLFRHQLQWEAVVRDVNVLNRSTSFDVREQTGVSLKSALRHIFSVDLRDDTIFPTNGSLFKLTSEVSGLGGDVGYLKNEILLQTNYALSDDLTFQGTLQAGFMRGLSDEMKIGVGDLYYLGGPLSVRGFETRGVGPHADGNALGARAFWATGLHLFTPLPFRPGQGGFGDLFKTHLFVTAGNVGNFRINDPNLFETLTGSLRLSYGAGIALRLGNLARLEVNYCFPQAFEKGDQLHAGVQFGIGVQFL